MTQSQKSRDNVCWQPPDSRILLSCCIAKLGMWVCVRCLQIEQNQCAVVVRHWRHILRYSILIHSNLNVASYLETAVKHKSLKCCKNLQLTTTLNDKAANSTILKILQTLEETCYFTYLFTDLSSSACTSHKFTTLKNMFDIWHGLEQSEAVQLTSGERIFVYIYTVIHKKKAVHLWS